MEDNILVKVRLHGDVRPWEEIMGVSCSCWHSTTEATKMAIQVAAEKVVMMNTVREIRWNWRGSLQGNYITFSERFEQLPNGLFDW